MIIKNNENKSLLYFFIIIAGYVNYCRNVSSQSVKKVNISILLDHRLANQIQEPELTINENIMSVITSFF